MANKASKKHITTPRDVARALGAHLSADQLKAVSNALAPPLGADLSNALAPSALITPEIADRVIRPRPPTVRPLPQPATGAKRLNPAQRVAREMFPPKGKPPPTMGTPEAVQQLDAEMRRRKLKVPSTDTLKRAVDRR